MSGLESKAREVTDDNSRTKTNFPSQLKLDIAEMKSLVESASRSKVKDILSVEVRERDSFHISHSDLLTRTFSFPGPPSGDGAGGAD